MSKRSKCGPMGKVTPKITPRINSDCFNSRLIPEAAEVYEDILISHPTDIFALKAITDTYFFLGDSNQIRDSVTRVLPSWKESTPLYGLI